VQEQEVERKLEAEATAARAAARRETEEALVRNFLAHMRDLGNPGTVRFPYADGMHLRVHKRPTRGDHRVTGWLLGTATVAQCAQGEEWRVSRELFITTDGDVLKVMAGKKSAWATTLGFGSEYWAHGGLAERLAGVERLERESPRK